jgi:hypothetical protein
MKKYLLPIIITVFFFVTGSVSYLIVGSDATASSNLVPDLRNSICVKNWKELKKNTHDEARWIGSIHVGIRYLNKNAWIKNCVNR